MKYIIKADNFCRSLSGAANHVLGQRRCCLALLRLIANRKQKTPARLAVIFEGFEITRRAQCIRKYERHPAVVNIVFV